MTRTTSHKDSLASFIWTMGAADMVIGGIGERGSLFAFGLVTVGAGVLVAWLRQRRYGRGPFPTQLLGASELLSKRLFRSAQVAKGSRAGVSRNSRAQRGTPINSLGQPTDPPLRRSNSARHPYRGSSLGSEPEPINAQVRPGRDQKSPQISAPFNPHLPGPPLNLPPAPRRIRRGRRIY